MKKINEQECIQLECIPTATVANIRFQYLGGVVSATRRGWSAFRWGSASKKVSTLPPEQNDAHF